MQDFDLGQTLLIKPEVTFSRVSAMLEMLGWRQEQTPAVAPLLDGEPEFVSWSRGGNKPLLVYSFNPLVNLRVLDVATLPPVMRGDIAANLPLITERDVNDLLFAALPRQRLLGLWAMQETERLDLLPQTTRLNHDSDPAVAEQSRIVGKHLQTLQESRESLLITLRLLADVAEKLIRQLYNAQQTHSLKPTHSELEQLFDAGLSEALHIEVENLYRQPLTGSPGDDYYKLNVTAANAGLLRWSNELSDKFPRGYRNIAGWMNPKWIWCTWNWSNDAGGSVRYDGLVWLETRWVWLPKVFRLVAPLLEQAAPDTAIH